MIFVLFVKITEKRSVHNNASKPVEGRSGKRARSGGDSSSPSPSSKRSKMVGKSPARGWQEADWAPSKEDEEDDDEIEDNDGEGLKGEGNDDDDDDYDDDDDDDDDDWMERGLRKGAPVVLQR